MKNSYIHGYDLRENTRLQDQASTLVELLSCDTSYPAGSAILAAGCGICVALQISLTEHLSIVGTG